MRLGPPFASPSTQFYPRPRRRRLERPLLPWRCGRAACGDGGGWGGEMSIIRRGCGAPAWALGAPPPAGPAAAQTVDEIIKRGRVVIAHAPSNPPFGVIGKDGNPEGFEPDV